MNRRTNPHFVLSVLVFLLGGSVAYTQEAPPQPVRGLNVWDSRGRMVGNVLGIAGHMGPAVNVAVKVENRILVLGVFAEGFVATGIGTVDAPLAFATPDCTGTAYSQSVSPLEVALTPSNVLLESNVYAPTGPPQNLSVGSVLQSGFPCSPVNPPVDISDATPLRLLVDLNNFFTPPFTLR